MVAGGDLWAQERTVSGKVTSSEDGTSLPGVNVLLKGTTRGVVTDAQGNYSISVPADGGTLVFTFIGLTSQEIEVGNRTNVDVQMAPDVTQLSEVVVTALGVSRETKTLTYASQEVKSENLNITQDVDVKGALSGKIAGVQVLSEAGSKLGEFGSIRIRGSLSLTQDKEPLYIVDGVPTPNPNDVDMNNVASINVLKGPSATALYGQRADAGVILITTKKGERNAGLSVELQSSTTWDKISYNLPKMQNLYGGGYGQDAFEIFDFDAMGPNRLEEWSVFDGQRYISWDNNYADESWGPKFDGQPYVPWYAWWPDSPYFGETRPYVAQPNNIKDFYETGVTAKNTISLRGGGENYNINISYTNLNQKGVTPFTDYTKHYVMANTEFDATEKLKFSTNIRYTTSEINGDFNDGYGNQTSGSFNSWFSRGVEVDKLRELKDLTTPDGYSTSWNWWGPDYYSALGGGYRKAAFWFNPYTFMERYKQIQNSDNIAGNLSASYKITDDLSVNLTASRNVTEYKRDYFVPFFLSNSAAPELYNAWSNSFGRYRRTTTENNYFGDLRYTKTLENFDFSVLLGSQIRQNTYQRFQADMPVDAKTGGLIIPDVYIFSNAGIPPVPSTYEYLKKVRSLYGNFSFGYKGLVYVDASYRRDWDSALPNSANGYSYGSIGANFIFSEVLTSLDFLSFGKLRGSWGKVGTDVDPLQLDPVYGTSSQAFQGTNIMTFTPNSVVNPNLVSPNNTIVEGGLDARLLENRLGFSFTYFKEERKDDIVGIDIPSATGFTSFVTNAGISQRSGIEISLDGDVIKSPSGFRWNVLFNFAKLKSEIVELPADQPAMTAPGGSVAFGFVTMAHQKGNGWGQLRGTAIKRDDQGRPILQSNGNYDFVLNQYLGTVQPDFWGGIVNRFDYKGISLVVNVDYQKGGKFFSLTEQWGQYSGLLEETAALNDKGMNVRDALVAADGSTTHIVGGEEVPYTQLDASNTASNSGGVHVTGVDAEGNVIDKYVDALQYFGQFYGNRLAEPFVHDKDYIKVREIALTYDLKNFIKAGFIKGATIGLVARNVALFGLDKGNFHRWDPQSMGERYGENALLPQTRSYGVNLNLRF